MLHYTTLLRPFLNSSQIMRVRIQNISILRRTFNPSTIGYCSREPPFEEYRNFSNMPQRPPSFLGKVIENLREEMSKNKKLKQNLKDFQKDMEELEKSEALQKAREKYKYVEEETAEGAKKAKQQLDSIRKKVVEEAQKAELLQKASKVTEEATKQAQKMGETLSQKGEEFVQTEAYKKISQTAKVVRDEIDQSTFGRGARVYKPPEKLCKRKERDVDAENKIILENTEVTGMVLHRDSKFSQSWENFKNNNPYVNRVLEWRTKLDESDNPIVRASILIKEKATDLFGGVFQDSDLSSTLTEICKLDPTFDKEKFLLECEYFIIPNVLEAMVRPDLAVLEDWCYERVFHILAAPIKQAKELGLIYNSKVLDIDHVELMMGNVVDDGPVLIISFQVQMIHYLTNASGEVVEGNEKKVLRVYHQWALCRDQLELHPHAAWRLIEAGYHISEQLI